REQVLDRAVLVMDVEVLRQRLDRDTGASSETFGHFLHAAVELRDVGVDLEAVARREHQCLVDVVGTDELGEELHHAVVVLRRTFQQRDRRGTMRKPNSQDAHTAATAARTSSGTAAPGTESAPVAFRCSWKARICSSMERSTLRTSTSSGTASTVGAKFRMLVMPAATSRSATVWAADAGVAMTPIDTSSSRITVSSSSKCRTTG